MKIVTYGDVAADLHRNREIDEIFFEASSVQSFASDEARRGFRQLWLGRYLSEEPEHAFVALGADGTACGYLIGSIEDPARRAEFSELTYFKDFAHLTARFPAHLHINVAQAARSQGIGAELIEAFIKHLQRLDVPGVHVVTGRGQRNVGFYGRSGFTERGSSPWRNNEVVLLGREIEKCVAGRLRS